MSSWAGGGPMDMIATTDTAQTEDRRRWHALVVLCVGMLMIVLDVDRRERRPAVDPG